MPKFSPVVPRRRRITSSLAVLALAVLTAAGCDSSTGNDDSIASLSVNPSAPVMHIGGVQQLVATPATSSGKIIEGRTASWTSSNPAVASVDGNGLVTALTAGTTTISASVGSLSDDAAVTVWHPVQSVTIGSEGDATTVCQEGTVQLIPTYVDASGATVTGRQTVWTTDNPAAAVVSTTGVITGGPPGGALPDTAIITGVTEGVSATFQIVTNCVAVVTTVDLTPTLGAFMAVGMTDQFVVTPHAPSGAVLDTVGRTVEFSSSDTTVATVSATGVVEMVGEGTADIVATVDGEDSDAVEVESFDQVMHGVATVTGTIPSGETNWYLVDVPVGTTAIAASLRGGTGGDPDLFLFNPSGDQVDVSGSPGPNEDIVFEEAAGDPVTVPAGRWLVAVNAWDGAADHTDAVLTVTLTPAPPAPPAP